MPWIRIALFAVATAVLPFPLRADDWPQWMGPERDGVWRETGIIEEFPEEGPNVLWRTEIGGGYAGPAVVGDRVYVTDKIMPPAVTNPANPFDRTPINAYERILCLSAETGEQIWKHEYPCLYTVSYPAGPRTTPVVTDGVVYTLGAEGHLLCLSADKGEVQWSKNLKEEYHLDPTPVWGFASNPLVDGDKLICMVGGRGTGVVAFDRRSGKELWRAVDATGEHGIGYSSPVIYEAGGTRQLIVWHNNAVTSLDPETGTVHWEIPFEVQAGLSLATPRFDENRLFITSFYTGAMLMKLNEDAPTAEILWKRGGDNERQTDALHSIIVTPVFDGDTIYGVDSYGEFRALDAPTGDRLWETYEFTGGRSNRWGTAFIVELEDRYVLFSENGDLIFVKLTREGPEEISRAHLLEPTGPAQRRDVVWSHPAFARKCVFARNDNEIVCVSLAK